MECKKVLHVCVRGKTCPKRGANDVLIELRKRIAELGLENELTVVEEGCLGRCGYGPVVSVIPDCCHHERVDKERATQIVDALAGEKLAVPTASSDQPK